MARAKRIKDNSDFSILIKYKSRFMKIATEALRKIMGFFPKARTESYPAGEGQEYSFFLIIIA